MAEVTQVSFSEQLRQEAGTAWDEVARHRFTDELAAGTVERAVMAKYAVQDHRFLDAFVVLLASMVAAARSLDDRIPGCQFLALITGRENTYFVRTFEALRISEEDRRTTPPTEAQAKLESIMRDAVASGSLSEILAVLVVCEWTYQSWGERVQVETGVPFYCQEWVDLHRGPYFGSVVDYLRGLLDREAAGLNTDEKAKVRARFMATLAVEKEFFDSCYEK
ncbi:hypothetical protein AB1Y20_006818 [Prymnesium parvum]|uniref:Thiaminase-2/PQQC domain-containing protein n=1 Tax=Prymnesium parvum TaxID=97485 RepID=A0AB34IZG4_PRYPA